MKERPRGRLTGTFLFFLSLGICLPLLFSGETPRREADWAQVAAFHKLGSGILREEGRFPLWTDALGGGYPFFSHPEAPAADPVFYLGFLLGLWPLLKLRVLLIYLLAVSGTYLFSRRRLKWPPLVAFLAAALFSFGSFFPYHVYTGNIYIGRYAAFPWLLFFLCGCRRKRFSPGAVLLFAWLFLGPTGLWVVAMLLFLGFWTLLGLVPGRREFPAISPVVLTISLGLGLALAAVRVLPLAELLQHSGRDFPRYSQAARGSLTPDGLVRSLLDPGPFEQGIRPPGLPAAGLSASEPLADSTVWIGPAALALAGLGLFRGWRRKWPWALLLGLAAILTMGSGSPCDLFALLWRLPLFRAMHLPNKYFAPFLQFFLALSAGFGFLALSSRRLLRWLVLAVAVLPLLPLAWHYHAHAFAAGPVSGLPEIPPGAQVLTFWSLNKPPPELAGRRIPFFLPGLLGKGNVSVRRLLYPGEEGARREPVLISRYDPSFLDLIEADCGVVNWYGWLYLPEFVQPRYFLRLGRVDASGGLPVFFPEAPKLFLNPQYGGELPAVSGPSVALVRRRSGRILLSRDGGEAAEAVLNLNWHPGWRGRGGRVSSRAGLLAFEFSGQGLVGELFFLPASFVWGWFISLLAAAALVLLWCRGPSGYEQ